MSGEIETIKVIIEEMTDAKVELDPRFRDAWVIDDKLDEWIDTLQAIVDDNEEYLIREAFENEVRAWHDGDYA